MFQIDRTIDLTRHSHPRQGHTSGERTSHSRPAVNASPRFPLRGLIVRRLQTGALRAGRKWTAATRGYQHRLYFVCVLTPDSPPCVSGGLEELETSKKRGSLYLLLERIRRFGLGKNLSSV